MSKMEQISFEPKITPERELEELSEKEKEVTRKAREIFRKNADLSVELLHEEDLNLGPRKIKKLNAELKGIQAETKDVFDRLEKMKPDSYKELRKAA